MQQQKISIDSSDVEFAYSDSGPVPQSTSYTTLVLIHGLCFSSSVFQKLQSVAPFLGVRAIAPSRRHYPGSTPLTDQELQILKDGTKAQRDDWITRHGDHLVLFIDALIQKHNLPPVSPDGKTGGVVILGWSLGTGDAISSIAHVDTLSSSVRSRLMSFIRSLILYGLRFLTRNPSSVIAMIDASFLLVEPPPFAFGLPPSPKFWAPFNAKGIPPECKFPMFTRWITACFDHGDLSTGDPNVLEWVLPSTSRPGSIYRMSKAEQDEIIKFGGALADVPYMHGLAAQLNMAYRKVLLSPQATNSFPNMKITYLTGEKGPGAPIAQLWAIQEEVRKQGVKMRVKIAPGINHFVHWDDPERAIDLFLECA